MLACCNNQQQHQQNLVEAKSAPFFCIWWRRLFLAVEQKELQQKERLKDFLLKPSAGVCLSRRTRERERRLQVLPKMGGDSDFAPRSRAEQSNWNCGGNWPLPARQREWDSFSFIGLAYFQILPTGPALLSQIVTLEIPRRVPRHSTGCRTETIAVGISRLSFD